MAEALRVLLAAPRHRLPRYTRLTQILSRLPEVTLEVLVSQGRFHEFARQSWRLSRQPRDWVLVTSAYQVALLWTILGRWRCRAKVILWYGGNPRKACWQNSRAFLRHGQLAKAALSLCLMPLNTIAERLASIIVVLNHPLAEELRQSGCRRPIVVLPSIVMSPGGPPLAAERPPPAPGVAWQVLTVTNLHYRAKADGVLYLMQRLQFMAHEGRLPAPVNYVILGDGLHLAEVRQQAAELTVPGRLAIMVLGFCQEVWTHYQRAHIFLYHSSFDGLASVMLEAAHAGLPILANRYPAFTAVLREGLEALYYDPMQLGEFDQHFLALLSDPQARQKLGQRAQAVVAARHSPEALAKCWEQLLRQGPEAVCLPAFPVYREGA